MSKPVSFKTAQLAKQFGFNKACENHYNENGKIDFAGIPAPTLEQLQSWLEEEKGMYISIAPEMYVDGINWNWQVLWYLPKDQWVIDEDGPSRICTGTGYYGDNGEFPTRHEALEAALQMALMKTDVFFQHNSLEGLARLYKSDNNTILNKLRQFSSELGDWSFREFTFDQLKIISAKLGDPPQE
jgi:hypothetical protein